ncbi:MAG: hypothetical protein ACRC6V_19205 [Bacteroidales bacterium]
MLIQSHKRFGFGKYEGRLVDDVALFDPGYIWWVENNTEYRFTPKVKRTARASMNVRQGRFPSYPGPKPKFY